MTESAEVVVVGAGSAGCVVAGRLAAAGVHVLLFEAGPAQLPSSAVGLLPVGSRDEGLLRYGDEVAPGTVVGAARGGRVGGSSAVNGAYLLRARPGDFGPWPAGWTFESMSPYYERILLPRVRVPIEDMAPAGRSLLAAATAARVPVVSDLDEAEAPVAGPVTLNAARGLRVDTAAAYLGPGVDVREGRIVRRVRVRRGRAIGVETDAGPVAAELVVLCAGSVGTPRLLLRSGIGAARTVAELGAEPVVDLPGVGRGGTDHPEVTLPLALDPGPHDPSRPILEAVAHLVLPEGEVEIRPYTAPFGRAIGGVDDPVLRVGVAAMTSKQRAEVLGGAGVRVHRSGSDAALLAAGVASVRDLLPTRGEAVLGVPLHLCGTARMGDSDEAPADGAGRIRGVEGLYVADGSAVPVVPTRGPHATVIAVAERLSEVLLRG